MVERPAKYFEAVAEAGGDSVTFHYEAVDDVPGDDRGPPRETACRRASRSIPETEPEPVAAVAAGRRPRALHVDPSRLLRPAVPAGHVRPRPETPLRATGADPHAGRRRRRRREHPRAARLRRDAARRLRRRSSRTTTWPRAYRGLVRDLDMSICPGARACARRRATVRIRSRRSAPCSSGTVWSSAEGVTEPGGRHAEVVALDGRGRARRGATLYVTLEPCAHHGSTPPCTDAIIAAGVARVVFAARDPNPEAAGGAERLRAAGVDVEFVDCGRGAGAERGVAHLGAARRPFVIYKAAVTLDGRVTVPGRALGDGRGEPAAGARAAGAGRCGGRRRRHGARRPARGSTPATSRLRGVSRGGSSSRRARSRTGVDLELRTGALADELRALGGRRRAVAAARRRADAGARRSSPQISSTR